MPAPAAPSTKGDLELEILRPPERREVARPTLPQAAPAAPLGVVVRTGRAAPAPQQGPVEASPSTASDEAGASEGPSFEPDIEPGLRLPPALSLSARLERAGGSEGAPAPTRPPSPRAVTAEDTEEAVRSAVRLADRELGLGNPQEGVVARVVQEIGRATGVPSGTHFVVLVAIDRRGMVVDASIQGDAAGDAVWADTLRAIRGRLAEKPVPLGPDERTRGVVVRVEATLLHIYPSGSDKRVQLGDCPVMPRIGGEEPAPFVTIGGVLHGDRPHGTCVLGDVADAAGLKTITVRTTTASIGPRDPPLPASNYPVPPPKRLVIGVMDIIGAVIDAANE